MTTPAGPTLSYDFHQQRVRRTTGARLETGAGEEGADVTAPATAPRLPRVTRLLALAHRFAELLERGDAACMAELARTGRVTRARVSQIMDLTLLAPDIQEEVLNLEAVASGRDPVTMREIRRVVRECYWPRQRESWRKLYPSVGRGDPAVEPPRDS